MAEKDGKGPEEQIINVRYSKMNWNEFRRLAKQKYDVDGSFAIKKLIDKAIRDREIPGVEPRLDYVGDGLVNDKAPAKQQEGKRRGPGFHHSSRKVNGEIVSGDFDPDISPTQPLILPATYRIPIKG